MEKIDKNLLEEMKQILEVQSNQDLENNPYMCGLYNGMEFMIALLEQRDPKFKFLEKNTNKQ